MIHSEKIDEISAALAKAQALIVQPVKNRTAAIKSEKGSYGYKYADLNGIIDAYRTPFSENGLSVVQSAETAPDIVVVTTMLLHSSGQWFRSSMTMPVPERRPQALGSATTYARRYSLSAMVGVAPDDDDDATTAEGKMPYQKPAEKIGAVPKAAKGDDVPFRGPAATVGSSPKPPAGFDPTNRAMQDHFIKIMRDKGITDDRWDEIAGRLKGRPSSDLEAILGQMRLA